MKKSAAASSRMRYTSSAGGTQVPLATDVGCTEFCCLRSECGHEGCTGLYLNKGQM